MVFVFLLSGPKCSENIFLDIFDDSFLYENLLPFLFSCGMLFPLAKLAGAYSSSSSGFSGMVS